METFDEFSDKAERIRGAVENLMDELHYDLEISFKSPSYDISRRFLNEINEFKPIEEVIE